MKNIFLHRLADGDKYHTPGFNLGCDDWPELQKALGDSVRVKNHKMRIDTDVPNIQECLEDFPADWSKADRELGLFIMLRGQVNEYYGTYWDKTMGAIGQLVIAGVDWSLSRTPDSSTWYTFCGTEEESGQEQKLGLTLVRKHEQNRKHYAAYGNRFEFGVDMPSIADILKASSGLFLEQLES